MSISADQERNFYDAQYQRFLSLPDSQLAVSRDVMLRTLADPSQPVYERRRLYSAVLQTLTAMPLAEMRALDYGCGPGDWGVWMATEGAAVTLLDLSPKAIELGLRRASASGVSSRVRGEARDASDLSCFETGEFDLVYASAAVHHTLKYAHAFEELIRVIRPGGWMVLAETYGNNPMLNLARRLRAWAENEAEEQGEEIVFSDREIAMLRAHFRSVTLHEMNLLSMAKRFFRGRFDRGWVRALVNGIEASDGLILGVCPFLKRYCGEVLIVAQK